MGKPDKKQIGRYLRYKLAFDRLDEALVEGWLLEAISLEESIITDRLLSIVGLNNDAVISQAELKQPHRTCRESDDWKRRTSRGRYI